MELCLRKFDRKGEDQAGEKPEAHPGSVVLLMNAFVSRAKAQDSQGSKVKCKGDGSGELGVVSGVCFVGQDLTGQREAESNFTKVQGDYSAIVHGRSSLIPPIFAIDGAPSPLRALSAPSLFASLPSAPLSCFGPPLSP